MGFAMSIPFAIPYVPDFHNLQLESIIGFVLGALFAVLFNAEGQAFLATTLGDRRVGATDRFHFNAFLHLDILGSLAFLLGGFGWPRWIDIDKKKFEHPVLYTIIARLGGPLANLLLAGIGASVITLVMTLMSLDPVIFLGVVAVNVTMAVYNLIPIPPMALGNIWVELLPDSQAELKKWLLLAGPYVIVALLLCDRIFQIGFFSRYLNPLVRSVFHFTAG
jgi:Zn-dependent protease